MTARTRQRRPARKPTPGAESLSPEGRASSRSPALSLRAEINLLRELVHQVGALAEANGPVNEQVRLLDAVGRACGQLARLLRAQEELGEEEEMADEIGRIVDEMRREMAGRRGEQN